MPEVGTPCDPTVYDQQCSVFKSEQNFGCNIQTDHFCLNDSMTGKGQWSETSEYEHCETNGR